MASSLASYSSIKVSTKLLSLLVLSHPNPTDPPHHQKLEELEEGKIPEVIVDPGLMKEWDGSYQTEEYPRDEPSDSPAPDSHVLLSINLLICSTTKGSSLDSNLNLAKQTPAPNFRARPPKASSRNDAGYPITPSRTMVMISCLPGAKYCSRESSRNSWPECSLSSRFLSPGVIEKSLAILITTSPTPSEPTPSRPASHSSFPPPRNILRSHNAKRNQGALKWPLSVPMLPLVETYMRMAADDSQTRYQPFFGVFVDLRKPFAVEIFPGS